MFSLMPWRKEKNEPVTPESFPLARLHNEFDALLERFFGRTLPFEPFAKFDWFGGVETEDKEGEVVLKLALPGFEPSELEVYADGPYLTIKAEHKVEGKEKEAASSYRTFRQTLTLPPEVEAEKIAASYRQGMLEIRLPKSAAPRGKRVEVKG